MPKLCGCKEECFVNGDKSWGHLGGVMCEHLGENTCQKDGKSIHYYGNQDQLDDIIKKKDVKYLQVPNVCFSLTGSTDDREPDMIRQRIERGFDDSETWSLTDTIANFIIPRLERFIEITIKMGESPEYIKDLDDLLIAMKLIARNNGNRIFTNEEEKVISKGLDIFPQVFMGLWW